MSYCEAQIIMELLIRALGFVLAIVNHSPASHISFFDGTFENKTLTVSQILGGFSSSVFGVFAEIAQYKIVHLKQYL